MQIQSLANHPSATVQGSGEQRVRPHHAEQACGDAAVRQNCHHARHAAAPATDSCEGLTYDAALMRKQKASLDILTQEGDRVQIRFRSREALSLQSSVAAAGEVPTGSGISLYAFAAGRVEVTLQGELSEGELQAISALMEKVDALATDFFAGDMEAAFASAAALGFDSDQLAGYALRMSLRESVRISGALPLAATPTPQAPEAQAPGAAAASAAVVAPPPAALPVVAVPAAPSAAIIADEPAVESSTAATTTGSSTPEASLQNTLGDYLRQVLGALAGPTSSGRLEFSMSWKLRIVIAAVESVPQGQSSNAAGTKLLTDSLHDLAANPATAAAAKAEAAAASVGSSGV
jgi:hypothetical protein